jgi:HEAT repeats
MWTITFGPQGLARGPAHRDPFVGATTAVVGDRSEKVRVQAALVLGRAGDGRAVPFLMRALSDPSPLVRAMAAQALGHIADSNARPSLEVAARDPSPIVRRHAAAALETLAERQAVSPIAVQPMGDKTHKASNELRELMRGFVAAELRGFGKVAGGYTVDGAIKVLSTSSVTDPVEVKCGVELVLSTAGRAIVMMSSGEAIVQRERRRFRPGMQLSMEIEALRHAVRGASEELRQHFAANGP